MVPRILFSSLLASSFFSFSAAAAAPETVVVTASRYERPLRETGSSVSVIDAAEWRARGAQFVADALQSLPGVAVTQSGGAGGQSVVRLRGEEGYRTLVLIDGIRIADPAAPQVLTEMAHLGLSGIERIEVVRGPQSLMHGSDAIGGVINIIFARGGAADRVELSLSGGSFGTVAASGFVSGRRGAFDAALSASLYSSEGFSAQPGFGSNERDGYDNATLHGVLGWQANDALRAEMVLRYSDAAAQFDRFGDNDNVLYTEQMAGRLSLAFSPDGGFAHLAAFNIVSQNRADYAGGAPFIFGSRFDGLRLRGEYQMQGEALGGTLVAGGDFEREEVATDAIDAARELYGVFGEWSGQAGDDVFVSLGGRYDHEKSSGGHFSFRATAALFAELIAGAEQARFHASIGTGFRAPSLFERLDAFSGNAGLVEETGFGFDFGVEQAFLDGALDLSVTYFWQEIEDEIRFDPIGFTYIQSDSTSLSQGIEFALSAALGEFAMLDVSYTWTDANVASNDAEDGLPRARRPEHMFAARLQHDLADGRGHFALTASGAAGTEDGFFIFRTDLPDYVIVGANAAWNLSDNVSVFVRGDNLLDAHYQTVAGFNVAGPSLMVGLRLSR